MTAPNSPLISCTLKIPVRGIRSDWSAESWGVTILSPVPAGLAGSPKNPRLSPPGEGKGNRLVMEI